MLSVIIAAHNEESVIGACLSALVAQRLREPVEIIVSANGCTDRTAEIAQSFGAIVVDRTEPGKAAALNAAERVATGFPRIYLDADIIVPPGGLEAVVGRLAAAPALLAAVPGRHLDVSGRPWPVRAYFAVNQRHPAFRTGLFGRGMIAVSRAGRQRFTEFPEVLADDLFLDSQFAEHEKTEVGAVEVVVESPRTTRDLLRRLVRVRRGNAQLRAAREAGGLGHAVRPADRSAWLRDGALRDPRLALAAAPYVVISVLAALQARRAPAAGREWGRDESTRTASQGKAWERAGESES